MAADGILKGEVIEGAKGGGSQRAPVEAPDSLNSIAMAHILDLVSEGEIAGFYSENPLEDVFLDETPVANPDGSLNFTDVYMDWRPGTQGQTYMQGFPSVENEIAIGVELRQAAPWVRTINNTSLDGIRLRLSVAALTKANSENGDINGYSVTYAIDLSVDGGAFSNVLITAFAGKTTSKYERSHRIDLPPANNQWVVRVRRLTPDTEVATIQDTTAIESITEVMDVKMRYPMSAYVGIKINAVQFRSIPVRSYRMLGRIISVPSNYDPIARTYAGVWNGTFKPAWTNNPAWVFYDIVTNKRYGTGEHVDATMVDKWALYQIAQYCDELVPDGRGGMEPRFTCTLFLQRQQEAYSVIENIASVFRGISYWGTGAIIPVGDMPKDPVYTYTNANVIDGKFSYQGSSRRARHSVALVSWNDPNDFGRQKVEYVPLQEAIARYGIRKTDITAVGCASQGQAQRWGRWTLLTEMYETDTVSFRVGLEGTLTLPGQIIRVADRKRAGKRIAGRIRSATSASITLDAVPEGVTPGNTLTIVLPGSGETQTRNISSVGGNTIQVSPAFSEVPIPHSVWAIESEALMAQQYRVLSVSEGDNFSAVITAIQHEPGKFIAVDNDTRLEPLPTRPIVPPNVQLPPTNLRIAAFEKAGEVLTQTSVEALWTHAPNAVAYTVEWRRDDGEWSSAQRVQGNRAELLNTWPGSYVCKVSAVNALGITSVSAVSNTFIVADQTLTPGVIDDLQDEQEQTWQELQDEVTERIQGDQQEAFNRTQAIAQEAAARAAELQELSDELWGTIEALQASISDILGAADHDPAVAWEEGDLVKADGKLYRALQAVPIGILITDTAYWELIGEYASLGDAVAATIARVNVLTTEVENLDDTLAAMTQLVTDLQSGLADAEGEITAQAGILTSLQTRVTDAEGELEAIADSILGINAEIASKASAAALQALTVRVTETEDTLESVATDITNLETALDGKASVSALNALSLRVTETEDGLEAVGTLITNINTELANKASAQALSDLTARVEETEDGIEALGTDLSLVSARVGEMPDNLIRKPRFEDGERGGWGGGTVQTVSNLETTTHGLQISGSVYEGTTAEAFAAHAGEQFEFSAWVNTTSRTGTGSVRLALHAINRDGGNAGFPEAVGGIVSIATTGWHFVRGVVTMPAGTSRARPLINLVGGSGTVVITDLRITRVTKYVQGMAEAASLLEARVSTTEQGIVSTAADITTLRATVGLELVPGRNLLTNPTGRLGNAYWAIGGNTSSGLVAGLEGGDSVIKVSLGTTSGNRNVYQDVIHPDFAGKKVQWSADVRVTGGTASNFGIDIIGLDINGQPIWLPPPVTYLTVVNSWQRLTIPFDLPTDVFGVRARVRCIDGNFTSFWIRNAKLEVGNAPTAYSDDQAYTTATQMLQIQTATNTAGVNTMMARHSMTLDVNGLITGWVFNNDGSTGTFDVRADRFSVTSPSGTSGLSWTNGALWNRRGAYSFITSDTLGENMMVYIGPTPSSPSTAKRADALFYVDSSGTGYFAGQVLQGIIRTFKSTTSTGNVTVTGDATSSNNKPVALKAIINRQSFQQYNGVNSVVTPGGGLTRVRVQIQRRYGSGTYTTLADQYVMGDMEYFSEPGAASWVTWRIAGDVMATDTASTLNRQYRVVLSEMTFQSVSVANPGTTPAEVRDQYTAIESME